MGVEVHPARGGTGLPGASPQPSPGPLSLAGLTGLLDDPSITATKLEDADCGDARYYRVKVEIDPADIDFGLPDLGALSGILGLLGLPGLPGGAPDPGATPGEDLPIDPIVIVVSVAKDTLRPVTLESDITMGGHGDPGAAADVLGLG